MRRGHRREPGRFLPFPQSAMMGRAARPRLPARAPSSLGSRQRSPAALFMPLPPRVSRAPQLGMRSQTEGPARCMVGEGEGGPRLCQGSVGSWGKTDQGVGSADLGVIQKAAWQLQSLWARASWGSLS